MGPTTQDHPPAGWSRVPYTPPPVSRKSRRKSKGAADQFGVQRLNSDTPLGKSESRPGPRPPIRRSLAGIGLGLGISDSSERVCRA